MRKILLFGLSLIILVACGGKKQEQTPSTITESIINETIINDTIVNDVIVSDAIINNDTTIHKYYYKDATDDLTRFIELEYYIPNLTQQVEDSILKTIACSLCESYYDSLTCKNTSVGMDANFHERILLNPTHYHYAIHYGKPISIEQDFISYTSWECHYKSQGEYSLHEYETVKHYLFDAKTGRRITVNEIFTAKGLSDMIDKVDQNLIVMLESALLFHPTEINNTQFTTDTITITYNPYAVSGYNQGIIQLKYPTNEILPYLNKKSVIYKAIAK